ncbi:MAG: hypothetical protein LBK06_04225 [Planctomycetaceae bacterium]|nr:hypothetical protein [Planctomycetaceae bacterium]
MKRLLGGEAYCLTGYGIKWFELVTRVRIVSKFCRLAIVVGKRAEKIF